MKTDLHMVFDVETTGLSATKHDIIQMAGILYRGEEVRAKFDFYCQPHSWINISHPALKVSGITVEQIEKFEQPEQVIGRLRNVLEAEGEGRYTIVGHNVQFDARFLERWWDKCNYMDFEDYFRGSYCTKNMSSKLKLNLPNAKLESFSNHYGFEFPLHNARADAIVCAYLWGIMEHESHPEKVEYDAGWTTNARTV